jgi:hypothetical protein
MTAAAARSAMPAARVRSRWAAALWHLLAGTLFLGALTYVLVRLWYPPPYAQLAGGLELLALLITVDVVLGPALTAVVASPGKLRRVFVRDLLFIVAVQLAAAGYGIQTLALARPIGLVFEVDQMRLVSAADVPGELLSQAPSELRALSWSGPRLMAAVKPSDPNELAQAIQLGMSGVELSMLPKQWRSYESEREAVLLRSRPIELLLQQHPDALAEVDALAHRAQVPVAALRFLPLRTRRVEGWVSLVAAPEARLVGHINRSPP